MFCNQCGRALPDDAARCPNCGADAALAEACGGFWGLTESGAPNASTAPAPDARLLARCEALSGQLRQREKREKRLTLVILVLSVLLILTSAAAAFLALRSADADEARRDDPTEEASPSGETDAPFPELFPDGANP